MKKRIGLAVALLLCTSLAACGGHTPKDSPGNTDPPATSAPEQNPEQPPDPVEPPPDLPEEGQPDLPEEDQQGQPDLPEEGQDLSAGDPTSWAVGADWNATGTVEMTLRYHG